MRLTNHEHCENQRRFVQNVARELSSITSSERGAKAECRAYRPAAFALPAKGGARP